MPPRPWLTMNGGWRGKGMCAMVMGGGCRSERVLPPGRMALPHAFFAALVLAMLLTQANAATERTGEQIVRAQCAKCHETGAGGAPKIGDRAAWIPRMKQGIDAVVRSAINGHGGMPARGGMANLTDAEMRSAVVYMFNPGALPEKTSASVAGGEDYKVVEGMK